MAGILKPLLPQFQQVTSDDYLTGAKEAAKWLETRVVETEHGIYWSNPDNEEIKLDIYSGSAGIILFYLEYAQLTGDSHYFEQAEKAADYLKHYIKTTDLTEYKPGLVGLEFTKAQWAFNSGHTGILFALIEVAKATGSKTYAETAYEATHTLLDDAEETDSGLKWSGYTGILADGGILLYLIYAAKYFADTRFAEAAAQTSEYFLSTSIPVAEDQIRFEPFDTELVTVVFGLQSDAGYKHEFPNFEYGTAGTAFILAKLYEWGRDDKYLHAAVKAANYVRSLEVEVAPEAALIPLSLPDLSDLFYVGYCHGPVGSSRVFQLLYELTGKPEYKSDVEKLARGIIATQAPELHSDGYWRFHGQCCGTASFIELFVNADKQAQDDEFINYALRTGDKLLSESFATSDKGASWPHSWGRLSPKIVTTDVGYFDGAAGIGSALLHLYGALNKQDIKIYMPDDTKYELIKENK